MARREVSWFAKKMKLSRTHEMKLQENRVGVRKIFERVAGVENQ